MAQNMKVQHIKRASEFDSLIKSFTTDRKDRIIVFRGQVTDYPLTASIFRGDSSLPAPSCDPFLTANWSNYCRRLLTSLSGGKIKTDFIHPAELALMQHYGYRSFFVDVTEDPEIALWFALSKFVKKTVPIYVDNLRLRSAKLTWARYQTVSSGFIYVLGIDEELLGQRYISLTKLMPSVATRVFRQKSGAISCGGKRRGADDLVLCKMEISNPDMNLINKAEKYTTKFLFPPPYEDRVYKCLCTIPYYVPIGREIGPVNIQLAEPMLPVPFFADSLRDIVKDYVPLLRILSGERVAYEWNVTQAKTTVNGNQYFGEHAHRILVYALLLESIKKMIPKKLPMNFEVWPSNNIIIEFDLDASLIRPSEKPVDSLLRGLWVVKGETELSISRIVDTLGDVVLGGHQIYDLSAKNLFSWTLKPESSHNDLQILYILSKALELGELKLEKEKFGYWRLKPKED